MNDDEMKKQDARLAGPEDDDLELSDEDEATEDSDSTEDSADEDSADEDSADEDSADEDGADEDSADEDGASEPGASEPGADDAPPAETAYSSNRSFREFPISPELLKGIEEKGYKMATRVQALTIEPALAGRDLVVRSKTGTGKTAAFCIPVLERVPAGERRTRAIVLAPTRELARQIAEEAAELARFKDLRIAVIYGGVGFGPQEEALKEGAEIVVGTPGRILDHLRRGNLSLSDARFAVLDEADEMLSMGFLEDVTKILDHCPDDRQVLLFSATVDDRVRALIQRYTREALDLRISTDEDKVEGIEHILYETSPDFHKARALMALIDLEEPTSAIIFCNTREDTATVATFLARQGLDVELLSGELPQGKREKVMASVKRGETQFLVATDVAARGIDISDLSHVINYSLPEDPKVYLHRTGRTGRIGKKGTAISLSGGADLSTRNILIRQHGIQFTVRPMPTAEEAARIRVERQARQIREAMGRMAFEGFMGTVRAIKERPDGDMLLAAALRAFFLWDRMRRAGEQEGPGSIEALQGAREEKREERRDGGHRRDGRREERGERRDGGPRRDGRREERGERRERPETAETGPAPREAPREGGANRKRRRRRRRGGAGGGEGGGPAGGGGGGGPAGGGGEG